ncbi:MAG: serine/threonine protein kinase, partial [Polyangiales bacterium]
MAEVFRAKTFGVEGFERTVAVKRILPNIARDTEFISMFIDEAKIAVQLNHANIAQIFDLGKVDDAYFIAMEYVHGKDLRALFDKARERGRALPIPLVCFVIMRLCEGLDYAHNKCGADGQPLNLVHRDVSPQNVLISYDGEVKVIDFGIAKAVGKANQTQSGILKGKFGYMSPEQVRGYPLDCRSDIFTVGICLYELLTGERLFLGQSDFSTLEKVRNVEVMPPSTYDPQIPEELERIVLKTLAKDPQDRYATALELYEELQAYVLHSGRSFGAKDLAAFMHDIFAPRADAHDTLNEPLLPPALDVELTPATAAARPAAARSASASPPGEVAAIAQLSTERPEPKLRPLHDLVAHASTPPAAPHRPMAQARRGPVPAPMLDDANHVPPPPPVPREDSEEMAAATLAASLPVPPSAADGSSQWEDEELSTHLYDPPGGVSSTGFTPSWSASAPMIPAPPRTAPRSASARAA